MKRMLVLVAAVLLLALPLSTPAQKKTSDWDRFTTLAKGWVNKKGMATNKTLKGFGIVQMFPGADGYVVSFVGGFDVEPKVRQNFINFCVQKGIVYSAIEKRISWDDYCPS